MRTTRVPALLLGGGTVALRAGSLGLRRSPSTRGEHRGPPRPAARETPVRSRLLRPALGLALASSGVLALGASAAPVGPVVIEDVVGDGNALNTQFADVPGASSGIATPGSQDGLDIVKVELRNTFGRGAKATQCTGIQIVMTLSGPAATDAVFDLAGETAANERFLVFAYDSGSKKTTIRTGKPGQDVTREMNPAQLEGNTLTWTISSDLLRRIGEKRGSVFRLREASTYFTTDIFSLTVIDKAPTGKTFTICK